MTIKATYQAHPVERFCNNPLTEALAIAFNKDNITVAVSRSLRETNFWELDEIYQNAVLQHLRATNIPHPQFYFLYSKFMSLLLDAYSNRNPFAPEIIHLKHELASTFRNSELKFTDTIKATHTIAASMVVHGHSGTGKTTAIRMALQCIPQVIEHESYQGHVYRQKQLVWISIDMPTTPSTKALALNFFRAVDDALGDTRYYQEWSEKSRSSVDAHLNAMAIVASNHELGLVHIDEIQFLLKYAKTANTPNLQNIEALFNKIGIPIVLSCTSHGLGAFLPDNSSERTVQPDMTTVRRMLSDRMVRFEPVKLDSDHFSTLFSALFPEDLAHPDIIIDQAFQTKFHSYACGLPAIMTRLAQLFYEVLVQFVSNNHEKLPSAMAILNSVFKDQFSLIEPALQLLRANQPQLYEQRLLESETGKPAFTNREKAAQPKKPKKAQKPVLKGGMYDKHIETPLEALSTSGGSGNNIGEQL